MVSRKQLLALACLTFLFVHAVESWSLRQSSHVTVLRDGFHQAPTPIDAVLSLLEQAIVEFPFAVVAVGILWFPSRRLREPLCRRRGIVGRILAILTGATCGAMLSFLAYLLLGGWGPPYFLPSILTGAVLAPLDVPARTPTSVGTIDGSAHIS